MRSVFTYECAVRRLDETVGEGGERRAESPVVDRQDDANVAAGLVVPKHAEFDLVALSRRARDLDAVVLADHGDEIGVRPRAIRGQLLRQERPGFLLVHARCSSTARTWR